MKYTHIQMKENYQRWEKGVSYRVTRANAPIFEAMVERGLAVYTTEAKPKKEEPKPSYMKPVKQEKPKKKKVEPSFDPAPTEELP